MGNALASATKAVADKRDRGGAAQPLLIVDTLRKQFHVKGRGKSSGAVRAVDGVSFSVFKGETLGIVGESGCGKSTLARLLLHLIRPDAGELIFDGDTVGEMRGVSVDELRRQVQMVFQDSYSSLNPRLPIQDSVAFGPYVHGRPRSEARKLAREMLLRVGLNPDLFGPRYPHELSGGQKQRVNIARALAIEPRMVILDEAVSALDKSIEAQVLNLLRHLKHDFNLTYIFISHDLSVVQYISDRVLVMYLGRVVELGPSDEIFAVPKHPYTRALLGSRSSMDPANRIEEPPIVGDPPSPIDPPSGCRFRTRCAFAEPICETKMPELGAWIDRTSHVAACHMQDAASGHSRARVLEPA
jgi:peptide/nickel transport system ATP-binding protein